MGPRFLYDHHATGCAANGPPHRHTDGAKETCTAYLMDTTSTAGPMRAWAVCGAYGEIPKNLADRIAASRNLAVADGSAARNWVSCVNY